MSVTFLAICVKKLLLDDVVKDGCRKLTLPTDRHEVLIDVVVPGFKRWWYSVSALKCQIWPPGACQSIMPLYAFGRINAPSLCGIPAI
jgi:hypothetical protein